MLLRPICGFLLGAGSVSRGFYLRLTAYPPFNLLHVAAGYRDPGLPPEDLGIDSADETDAGSRDHNGARCSGGCPFLLLGGITIRSLSSSRGFLLAVLGFLAVAASAVQLPESSGLMSGSLGRPWTVAQQVPNLASVAEHTTLSRSLVYIDSRQIIGLTLDGNAGQPVYQFCVWAPGDRICFLLMAMPRPLLIVSDCWKSRQP